MQVENILRLNEIAFGEMDFYWNCMWEKKVLCKGKKNLGKEKMHGKCDFKHGYDWYSWTYRVHRNIYN